MKQSLILAVAVAALFWSCNKVPLTGRKQLNMLPESNMLAMSLESYNEFLQTNQVVKGTPEANLVAKVGNRIATATESFIRKNGYASRIQNFDWEFHLVDDKAANAWCMPGGKVVFYTGILPITKTEVGMAVVMGHEVAHAVARHGNERMSQGLATQLGGVALSVALEEQSEQTRALFLTAYGMGTTLGVMLPYSRLHESEADRLGLIFMAMAGYDPHEAAAFWERMAQESGPQPPEFLSTHPSHETRIQNIREKYLPEAMQYYKPTNTHVAPKQGKTFDR